METRLSQIGITRGRISDILIRPESHHSPAPAPEGTPDVPEDKLIESETAREAILGRKTIGLQHTLYAFRVKELVPMFEADIKDPSPHFVGIRSELDDKNWTEVLNHQR